MGQPVSVGWTNAEVRESDWRLIHVFSKNAAHASTACAQFCGTWNAKFMLRIMGAKKS